MWPCVVKSSYARCSGIDMHTPKICPSVQLLVWFKQCFTPAASSPIMYITSSEELRTMVCIWFFIITGLVLGRPISSSCNPPFYWFANAKVLSCSGTGAVYSFDPVGSYEREACRAAGAAQSLVQPFLDNQVSLNQHVTRFALAHQCVILLVVYCVPVVWSFTGARSFPDLMPRIFTSRTFFLPSPSRVKFLPCFSCRFCLLFRSTTRIKPLLLERRSPHICLWRPYFPSWSILLQVRLNVTLRYGIQCHTLSANCFDSVLFQVGDGLEIYVVLARGSLAFQDLGDIRGVQEMTTTQDGERVFVVRRELKKDWNTTQHLFTFTPIQYALAQYGRLLFVSLRFTALIHSCLPKASVYSHSGVWVDVINSFI